MGCSTSNVDSKTIIIHVRRRRDIINRDLFVGRANWKRTAMVVVVTQTRRRRHTPRRRRASRSPAAAWPGAIFLTDEKGWRHTILPAIFLPPFFFLILSHFGGSRARALWLVAREGGDGGGWLMKREKTRLYVCVCVYLSLWFFIFFTHIGCMCVCCTQPPPIVQ